MSPVEAPGPARYPSQTEVRMAGPTVLRPRGLPTVNCKDTVPGFSVYHARWET